MTFQHIFFIGLSLLVGLCLHVCVVSSQNMQPHVTHSRYSVSTIISTMNSSLTSLYGACSFPPKEVLTNVDSNFLEMCDRKIPSFDKAVSDPGAIMCLGLLELGLRVCSLDKQYLSDVVFALPKDSHSFNTLIMTLNEENDPNLCTDLKKALERPMIDGDNFALGVSTGLLKNWSLQNVLHEKEESCSKICIDYLDKPQLLCKLILWGINNLLVAVQPNPKPVQAVTSHNVFSNVDLSEQSLIVQGQTGKTAHEPFSQNDHAEAMSEHVVGDRMNDLETSDGKISAIPSSSEVTPVGEAKDIYKPKLPDNKASEIVNTDAKKSSDVTKSVHNSQSETPLPVNSVESIKGMENFPGLGTTSIKQEVVISEHPEKSLPKVDTASIDSIKSQEITIDEKPSLEPAEKVPTDIAGRDNDIPHQYDESFNDLDDDDSNVEQIPMNHESTGDKADTGNKYSPDEFSNANTFLQERFEDSEDSHFFSYFMAVLVLCIVGYVVFHNKQKILALALEGRSRRTTRRRSATANYHKLDNNLEEAVSSPCNTSVTHVIY